MTGEDEPVQIETLDIVRAPGFETNGFSVDELSSGINLIHGPNAAGKTTTAESIEKMLWPDAADTSEQLVGHLSMNGERWRVDVSNGTAEYQRNGQEAGPPTLPSQEHRDRYRLCLHDLMQQETRNESFAETIERESAGGFDIAAAHDELGYKDSPITRNKGEYQTATRAVEAWREKRREAEGLEEERSRLTRLRDELEDAKQARAEKTALNQAITYCEAKTAFEKAKDERDAFPDVLERVDGDEFEQVETLDDEIREWKAEKTDAEKAREDAEDALDEAALPDDGVPDGKVTGLKKRRDDLDDAESRKRSLGEELEAAKETRRNARTDIPLDVEQADLIDLDPGAWAEVSEFARHAQTVHAEQEFQQSVSQWVENEDPPEEDLQALKRGSKALEEWLITVPETGVASDGDAAFRIGVASALIVSIAGITLGVLVNPILFAVVLLGIGLFAYGYHQRQDTETVDDGRTTHRNSFEQTGLASPESWTEAAVRDRLIEIYDAIAEYEIIDERRQKRDTLLDKNDLEEKQQALAEKREELEEKLGTAPDATDIELAVIVRRVLDWQRAHDAVVGLEKELETVAENLSDARNALQNELAAFGYEDIEDSADAAEAVRDLEHRKSKHENATRDLDDAVETIETAEQKISEAQEQRDQVFTTLELDPGDRTGLQALCDQIDEYEQAKKDVERAKAVVEQEEAELEGQIAYEPELKDRDLQQLKRELREVEDTANRHDEIQKRIADIEAKIREAKTDTEVEDAIAEKDRALDTLREQLDADQSAMVGDVLVNHVQDVAVEANRPAVFRRANELLATITYGRYELDLVEGEQTFRAFDTATQKGYALDELSSGTRVQVLLAVRLAFVEQQEHGAKLPIVLDETLANTDDLRAEVIIDSLIELARDGRQIFYFSAQGDEVAKWHDALEDSEVDWTTIDLADVRELDGTVQVPDLDTIDSVRPDPPSTTGHDHESYGELLDVPPFNPYNGAGTAHLWYLVEDIDVLHDLLEIGVDRVGQLENLLDRGRNEFVPADAETLETIQQNAAALDEFAQCWQIGRGDPVDRDVLEASGAISETFIDRVTELAAELGGDGKQLVEALHAREVDRFRGDKADELDDYLQENGYIVSRDPLDDDELSLRMTERLVDQGVPREQAAARTSDLLERVAHG